MNQQSTRPGANVDATVYGASSPLVKKGVPAVGIRPLPFIRANKKKSPSCDACLCRWAFARHPVIKKLVVPLVKDLALAVHWRRIELICWDSSHLGNAFKNSRSGKRMAQRLEGFEA
jgi:hypothetical protein